MSATDTSIDASTTEALPALHVSARRLGVVVTSGFLAGAVAAGGGGRLAMFILRLTSSGSVIGRKTDDGFVIGRFSGETFFLVAICALGGIIVGLAYLGFRSWLPERHRPLYTGAFTGLFAGALIVKPGGIDFTALDPLALAIVLFVVVPFLYGLAMSWLAERWLPLSRPRGWPVAIAWLLPLVFMGPYAPAVLFIATVVWLLNRRDALNAAWRSPVTIWIGRGVLTVIALLSAVDLVADSIEIL